MFEKLQVLRIAGNLATHASARQEVIAQNVANADTPGYRAKDLPSFAETFHRASDMTMRATRPGHLTDSVKLTGWQAKDAPDQESPNGNSVSLEEQMVKAAGVRKEHDTALAVYASALGILRTSLGRR